MSAPHSFFDPAKDGRGIWVIIHKKAIQAINEELKNKFVEEMNWYAENYPCNKCKNHLKKYIKENPFELYWYVSIGDMDIGMFKWSWGCHNSVNERLKKQIITFENAYNLYDPKIIHPCTADCEEDEESKEKEEKGKFKGITGPEIKKSIKKEKLIKFKITPKK